MKGAHLEHILGPGHIVELSELAVVADVAHVGEALGVQELPGRLWSGVTELVRVATRLLVRDLLR